MKEFEVFLVARAGLMPVTVKGYLGSIKRTIKVIGENPDNYTLEKYVSDLYNSDYSYHHKTNTVLALEKYLEFIGKPTRFGRQRKPKTIIKNTLSEAEITKLIFSTSNSREKAIISLMAYSGIRNQEVCNLKVKDFLYTQNAIRIVQGKLSKDGISEVTPECSFSVIEYLKEFPREENSYLFTTLVRGNKMETGDIRKWVKVIAKRARLEKRVYPHLLRHSLVANMLMRGADIVSLQHQLRHSWLATTLEYANSIVMVDRNRYQSFAPSYC